MQPTVRGVDARYEKVGIVQVGQQAQRLGATQARVYHGNVRLGLAIAQTIADCAIAWRD